MTTYPVTTPNETIVHPDGSQTILSSAPVVIGHLYRFDTDGLTDYGPQDD